jgi:hypothetical protein
MNRDNLIEIIEKYYLGGLTEKVKLKIKNKKIKINFTTELQDCVGEIEADTELGDNELGIYNTSQLYKLAKLLNDPIEITINERSGKCYSLTMTDEVFELNYTLADLGLIKEGNLKAELPPPNIVLELDEDFIHRFVKAHNAIDKAEVFKLKTKNTKKDPESLEFIIGLDDKFSNKISFHKECTTWQEIPQFKYNVSVFREILNSNKKYNITMSIWDIKGIIRLDVHHENIKTKYYLVSKKN